jgi:uncharacterized membrane protein
MSHGDGGAASWLVTAQMVAASKTLVAVPTPGGYGVSRLLDRAVVPGVLRGLGASEIAATLKSLLPSTPATQLSHYSNWPQFRALIHRTVLIISLLLERVTQYSRRVQLVQQIGLSVLHRKLEMNLLPSVLPSR